MNSETTHKKTGILGDRDGGQLSTKKANVSNLDRGDAGDLDRGDAGNLDREEIFGVLSNERRRHALRYLNQLDEGLVELGDLVDYITARENGISVTEIDYKQRKRVYSSLRQTHLPTLSKCGLIEYDRDRGTIELNGAADEVQMYLEYVPANDIPWCYHYLGLMVVSGVLVALTGAGVSLFGRLSGIALATIIVAAFGLSAIVHTIYTKRNEL